MIYLVVLLSSAMILVVVAVYWKNGDLVNSLSAGAFVETKSISEQMEFNQNFFLILMLLLIIILGLVVDLAIHIARRDGFHKGLSQSNNHSSFPKLS